MRGTWAMLAPMMVAFAGCMEGSATGLPEAPGQGSNEATADEAHGALKGQVINEELQPIANASVGLVETGAQTQTGEAGEFGFSQLAAGTYTVQAVALGYASAAKRIDVEVAEVSEVQFTLEAVPIEGPYHETTIRKGMVRSVTWRIGPRCDTIVQPPIGTCLGLQFQDVTIRKVTEPDWATILDEVTWVPNSGIVHQRAYVFATFPNVTDFSGVPDFKSPGHFETGGPSPQILRIERQTLYDRKFPEQNHYGNTRFRALNNFDDVNASGLVGVSMMLDQPMSVFLTIFYEEVAPREWSALPDR